MEKLLSVALRLIKLRYITSVLTARRNLTLDRLSKKDVLRGRKRKLVISAINISNSGISAQKPVERAIFNTAAKQQENEWCIISCLCFRTIKKLVLEQINTVSWKYMMNVQGRKEYTLHEGCKICRGVAYDTSSSSQFEIEVMSIGFWTGDVSVPKSTTLLVSLLFCLKHVGIRFVVWESVKFPNKLKHWKLIIFLSIVLLKKSHLGHTVLKFSPSAIGPRLIYRAICSFLVTDLGRRLDVCP